MTSTKVRISKYCFTFIERKSRFNVEEPLEFRWLFVDHFKVHLAYAATKRLRMCGMRKIFRAAGFMCACHARMYADAPMPTLAYLLS